MPKKESLQLKNDPRQERMLTDGMTQEEVAEVMGIKRQAVNNIEKLALRKLKYIIARKYTKGDLL